MPRLILSKGFLSSYGKLPKDVRKKVDKLLEMFEDHTGAGINLEKPHAAVDDRARTVRVDQFWRGVVAALGGPDNTHVLVDVLPHDAAYAWCKRNRFGVNPATGALEIHDIVAIDRFPAIRPPDVAADRVPLLSNVPDEYFTQLGIPSNLLPLIRTLDTEEELDALTSLLPQGQADAILGLAAGMSPESIYAELVAGTDPGEVDPSDLVAAAQRPASGSLFYVVRDADELQDILSAPFEHWRLFLHPSQRRLAYRDNFSGPVKVTGGAGTGKTVVAMHRAWHLARAVPEDGQQVLLTTFTRSLATNLEAAFRRLAGDVADRVLVTNVDSLAHQIVREAEGRPPWIELHPDDIWASVASEVDVGNLQPQFLAAEYDHVILGQDLRDRQAYLEAPRPGQGVALDRRARTKVWAAVQAFEDRLRAAGARTFLQLARDAADYLQQSGPRFMHVVVDEAQDLHAQQWRMLRALVPEQVNDMFIVGDAHQRIYDRHVSLRTLGIHVVGRSYRLRLNYRTTEEILRWSLGLLTGSGVDDLDGGADTLAGYRSTLHGPPPVVVGYRQRSEELDGILEAVQGWLADGIDATDIGVTARTRKLVKDVARRLRDVGVPVSELEQDDDVTGGVNVGTMHRMKGLEFRCVAVVGVEEGTLPLQYAVCSPLLDPMQHQRDMQRERSLLFVACTRARDMLRVSWTGQRSSLLPA